MSVMFQCNGCKKHLRAPVLPPPTQACPVCRRPFGQLAPLASAPTITSASGRHTKPAPMLDLLDDDEPAAPPKPAPAKHPPPAKPKKPAASGGLDLAEEPEEEQEESLRCPKCYARYPVDTTLCTECGIDLRTGEPIGGESEEDERRAAERGAGAFVRAYFPGVYRTKILAAAGVCAVITLGVGILGLFMLSLGAVLPAITILGVALLAWVHASAWIVAGELRALPSTLAELRGSNPWVVFLTLASLPIFGAFAGMSLMAPGGAAGQKKTTLHVAAGGGAAQATFRLTGLGSDANASRSFVIGLKKTKGIKDAAYDDGSEVFTVWFDPRVIKGEAIVERAIAIGAEKGQTVALAFEEPEDSRSGPAGEAREITESASAAVGDREAEEALKDGKHEEARAWCKKPAAMGFEVGTDQMLEIAEGLYGAGATDVQVVGIDTLQGREISAAMVATLPEDPAARKKLFAWAAGPGAEVLLQETPPTDVGQRYLYLVFD